MRLPPKVLPSHASGGGGGYTGTGGGLTAISGPDAGAKSGTGAGGGLVEAMPLSELASLSALSGHRRTATHRSPASLEHKRPSNTTLRAKRSRPVNDQTVGIGRQSLLGQHGRLKEKVQYAI